MSFGDLEVEIVDQDREVLLDEGIALPRHRGGEFGLQFLRPGDVALVRVERIVEGLPVVLVVPGGRGAFGRELRFEVDQLLRVGIAGFDPVGLGGRALRGFGLGEGGRGGQQRDEREGGGEGLHGQVFPWIFCGRGVRLRAGLGKGALDERQAWADSRTGR